MSRYPKELFSIREDVTRENIRKYEAERDRLYKKCEELYPDFWSLSFRERMKIKKKVEEER